MKAERICDPVRIQTWNLLIRSQMLYSIELRGHNLLRGANININCQSEKTWYKKAISIYRIAFYIPKSNFLKRCSLITSVTASRDIREL